MRVVWTRVALTHLDEIQDYIAQDSPAAAFRVAVELTDGADRLLSTNPMIGRLGRARGTRELVFDGLPYIVAYPVTNQVEILAVVHTARQWPESFD
jgi:toxin ParE1/3/4